LTGQEKRREKAKLNLKTFFKKEKIKNSAKE